MSHDNDDPKLPGIVEGVLGLFEGLGGVSVAFRCVNRNVSSPCIHCGELTSNRLETIKSGETLSITIACRVCLKEMGEAARDTE